MNSQLGPPIQLKYIKVETDSFSQHLFVYFKSYLL